MSEYYEKKLNAEKLKLCYEIAPPRVKQYLYNEVNYVLEKISSGDITLDLGCGYGRIIPQLKEKSKKVIGIDISVSNLIYGIRTIPNCNMLNMDAISLGFQDNSFNVVVCIQN